jgi:hypothetical protein
MSFLGRALEVVITVAIVIASEASVARAEGVGAPKKDASTHQRLYAAATVLPVPGGSLPSVGRR